MWQEKINEGGSSYLHLSLDIMLIEDKDNGGYTAVSPQFPELIAEGNTKKEAFENIMRLVSNVPQHEVVYKKDV